MQIDDSQTVDLAAGTTTPLNELPREVFMVDAETQNMLLSERSYLPLGLPLLRETVARMYTRQGLPTTSDQVLITSGAQQAISLITALYVQRGDTVLVEIPTYFGALDIFRLAGARLSGMPIGAEHIEKSMLRDRIRTAGPRLIYLTPTYQNPTGAVMPEITRQAVGALADEFGIPLIEDHTLSQLTLEGTHTGFYYQLQQERHCSGDRLREQALLGRPPRRLGSRSCSGNLSTRAHQNGHRPGLCAADAGDRGSAFRGHRTGQDAPQ